MAGGMVMVPVGRHRLAATVIGAGAPAVVIEPSFGGCAADWQEIAGVLAEDTAVVTYDRAPYGASSAARDKRTPHDIATDLDGLLRELQVTGPVVEATDSMIVVTKGKERFEIDRDANTKVTGDLKVGDKVTIMYTMTAKEVEVKADKSAKKDAKAAASPAAAPKK